MALAPVIHEPHRQTQRFEYDIWHDLLPAAIKRHVIRRQLREAQSREPIRKASTVTGPRLRRCPDQVGELLVFPVDIRLLFKTVVDLEEGVGLAAHCAIPKQRSNDQSVLSSWETSHGVVLILEEDGRSSPL